MMTRLLARAMARMRSMSAGKPKRCTGIIARVLGVMAASSSAGLRLKVAGSMCTKKGLAPPEAVEQGVRLKKKRGGGESARWAMTRRSEDEKQGTGAAGEFSARFAGEDIWIWAPLFIVMGSGWLRLNLDWEAARF